mmetsp:Transcript_30043/g.89095  ORF Transcript_30043/g.89095 Transcript_30043/m.89095 type:complete len:234 (-) Transcript_30043:1925-2626(-)
MACEQRAVDGAVQVVDRVVDAVLRTHRHLNLLRRLEARWHHERLERLVDTVGRQVVDRHRHRPHARAVARGTPKRLVAEKRHDERGLAAVQPARRGAGAAVVHDRTAALKQPVVRRRPQQQHVGMVVAHALAQAAPALLDDCAQPRLAQRTQEVVGEALGVVDHERAKADVHGRGPCREEVSQLFGRRVVCQLLQVDVDEADDLAVVRPVARPRDERRRPDVRNGHLGVVDAV